MTNNSLINENIESKEYKKKTFSGYKKTQVFSQLKKCILKQELDRACIWAVELDVSGHVSQIWEDLIIFGCTEINLISPNLPNYLLKKYKQFLILKNKYDKHNLMNLRNNQESRNKLCDFICTITLSPKKKFQKYSKIQEYELSEEYIVKKMSTNKFYNKQFVTVHDPTVLKIASNEIILCLINKSKGTHIVEKCFYWIDWLQCYEKKQLKQKKNFNCSIRKHLKKTNKFDNYYIWLLWEIIFCYCQKKTPQSKSIHSLYELYKLNFTKGKKNKKMVFLKYAFLLILDCVPKVNYETPIFYKSFLRWKATLNINEVYRIINYNKKYIGYKNSKNEQIISENENSNKNNSEYLILNTKKITKLNNPEINKKFGEYLRNKQFCPSKNLIREKYNNYVNKVRNYNKQVYENNKKKQRFYYLKKKKENKIVKNINKFLNDKTHLNQKSKIFNNYKPKINSLFKQKSKLKYDNKLSNLYNKL